MKDNTKKIIAREGLIILGIIGVGFLAFFLSSIYPPMPKTKNINIYENLTQQEKDSINVIMSFREKYPEYDDLDNLSLAEKLSKKYPEYLPIYEGLKFIHEKNKSKNQFDIATAKTIEQNNEFERFLVDTKQTNYLDEIAIAKAKVIVCRNKISSFGLLIVVFGYPIYLLILFIVWAVKTLRLNPSRK